MNWQVKYAIDYISKTCKGVEVTHISEDAIQISIPNHADIIAIISEARSINDELAKQYHQNFPDMDFLCGYRKECVWEGEAIRYLESNSIGWGNAITLDYAISTNDVNTASHQHYFFSYRLIQQYKYVNKLEREFDRVFNISLANGRTLRVGMIMEYEPTADAIRTFWDNFGPIDIAWNINPNGNPTHSAIEAAQELGCEVLKWEALKQVMRRR